MKGYNDMSEGRPDVGKTVHIVGNDFSCYAKLNKHGVFEAIVQDEDRNKKVTEVQWWKYEGTE